MPWTVIKMLIPVNPIKEAEERLLREKTLINNFGFTYEEVQRMEMPVMNYLFKVLIEREKKRKFEEMKRKNG